MGREGVWFDLEPRWKENKLFTFIVSMRGPGKTFASKRKAIENFLTKKETFVYLRRYKREINVKSFFADVSQKFEGVEFAVKKSSEFYINGEYAGCAIPLSIALTKKSVNFNSCSLIIFDEFLIPEASNYRYLHDDVKQFLDFYETVNRLRIDGREDCRVLFLANTFTLYNPYFNYFGIRFKENQKIVRKDDIYCEIYKDKRYQDAKLESRFGRLIAGTEYGAYAVAGEFMEDNPMFVMKRTPRASYHCTLVINSENYGVWVDYRIGLIFVSFDVDPSCRYVYAFSSKDHGLNTMLLKSKYKAFQMRFLSENYKIGNVRYESQKVKNATEDTILYFV